MAQDDEAIVRRFVLSSSKPSAPRGCNAQQREKLGRDPSARQSRRRAVAGKREPVTLGVCRDIHRADLAPHRREATVRIGAREADELLGSGERQAREQNGVGQAVDGGVRADAERECQDADSGESRAAAQHPRGITHVLHRRLDDADPARVATRFLRPVHAAEVASNDAPRLGGLHASRDKVLDLLLQVKAQLVVEFLLDLRLPRERSPAERQHIQ
jgi:hypothetical protein